jgi:hypothetical protein
MQYGVFDANSALFLSEFPPMFDPISNISLDKDCEVIVGTEKSPHDACELTSPRSLE